MMNICLYGASSNEIPHIYIETVEDLGEKMAERGHTLVFGGGANGLMGAVAREITSAGGKTVGIAPSFFNVDGVLFDCTEMHYTETMRQRKKLMEEKADAFIAVPGGIGTFDELFEIMTLKQLGRHKKPIAVLNINGYYEGMDKMLENAANEGFMTEGSLKIAPIFTDIEQLLNYIESATQEENLSEYKNVFKK